MRTDQIIDKVQGELQHRFRLAGRGSVQRVQEQLQLGAGYFRDLRRPGRQRFDLRVLLDALHALEVDEAEFFASVLGKADPLDTFCVEGSSVLRRLRRAPRVLRVEAERHPDEPRENHDLDALDAERHDHPRRVMQRACRWMQTVRDRRMPRLLGIYASAARTLGKLDEAQAVLCRGFELALEQGNRHAVGELAQRAAYVLVDRGQYERALTLAERATSEFVAEGDVVGAGKTLVDRGGWERAVGRPEEALRLFRAALRYLPAHSERIDVRKNRFACWTLLGVLYSELEQPKRASRFLRRARHIAAAGLGRRMLVDVLTLDASISRQGGDYSRAADLLTEALPILHDLEPLDAALTAIDLAKIQLVMGRAVEAYETAKSMTLLLKPLERNPVAAAAITELVRVALTGQGLNATILDRVAKDLAKGRERQGSRSR